MSAEEAKKWEYIDESIENMKKELREWADDESPNKASLDYMLKKDYADYSKPPKKKAKEEEYEEYDEKDYKEAEGYTTKSYEFHEQDAFDKMMDRKMEDF